MGSKTPRPIKIEVIRRWLQGKPRDKIAEDVQIGAGTVSGIIKESRENDPEFDLLRETAVKLKNQNISVESFAPLVRLREVLQGKEWLLDIIKQEGLEQAEEKIQSLIVGIEVFCFKQSLPIKDFVGLIHYLSLTANRLGAPLEELPAHITQLERNVRQLLEEIKKINSEKQDALQDYDATINLLDEYKRNKPLFEKSRELQQQIKEVKKQKESYKIQLEHERLWKSIEEEHKWSIPESELIKANRELDSSHSSSTYMIQTLSPSNLKEMVMDVFYYPSRYAGIIMQMTDIYNSEHKEKEQ